MTRAVAVMLGALVVSLVAAGRPPDASASVLCLVRKKSLVVRDQCRAREETLTADRKGGLGLTGPPGSAGVPGPATGSLRVIDAVGREVGLVIDTNSYSASARIVGVTTLPGRSTPEFFIAQVDGTGLQNQFGCRDIAEFFETSTCDGPAYADCSFGDCESVPGSFFAQPILYESSATGCFFGDPSEARSGTFFRRSRVLGTSVASLNQQCRNFSEGTLVSPPVRCHGSLFCADCCAAQPASGRLLTPVHSIDASLLGTPQFRLSQ